jgi:adenylate cyclase
MLHSFLEKFDRFFSWLIRGFFRLLWSLTSFVFSLLNQWFGEFLQVILEKHSGLFFSFIATIIAVFCFGSGLLRNFDDNLQALIFQKGYSPGRALTEFLIVKKDERTSALIGQNPGRPEFASILSFLGKSRTVKLKTESGEDQVQKFKFLDFRLGSFEDGKPLLSLPLVSLQIPGSRSQNFFQFWEKLSRLFFELLEFPKSKNWPGSPDQEPQRDQAILAFLKAALSAELEVHTQVFPRPGTLLQFTFTMAVDYSQTFFIPPASMIVLDFILQGQKNQEDDQILINSIASSESPIILGAQLLLEKLQTRPSQGKLIKSSGSSTVGLSESPGVASSSSISPASGVSLRASEILPHPMFKTPHTRVAFVNASPDGRGYLSKMPMFVYNPHQDQLKPCIALSVAAMYFDQKSRSPAARVYERAMENELMRILPLFREGRYTGGFQLLDRYLPLDKFGYLHLNFQGSTIPMPGHPKAVAQFPSVSFYEAFDPEMLKSHASRLAEPLPELLPEKAYLTTLRPHSHYGNRIILIGPFEKSDFDFYPTPMTLESRYKIQGPMLTGIEIHANAIANILHGNFLKPAQPEHILFLLITATLLLGVLMDHLQPTLGGLMMLVFTGGITWFSYHLYHVRLQIFFFSPFLVSFPLSWTLTTLVNYLRQLKKATATKALFQRFVSPDVVQFLIDNPDSVRPGGQKVELTIFFSDLAGFTTISESLTPEKLVELMNEYLGAMTELLFKYGGTLDKYIGDAVMAYWNFPQRQEDHAVRACLYTIEMHEKLTELQADWKKRGFPKAYARAGMNTAKVVVGCMGSQKVQMNFTCLGDGVNLASRLEGANKEYGTLYMVSDATYQQAKHRIRGRFLDFLAVKGKKEPVKVHELICEIGKEPPGLMDKIALYDKGISLHLERKWDDAIAALEELLTRWPEDGPAQTYLKRCFEYKENPPPDDWDGSYHLTHK